MIMNNLDELKKELIAIFLKYGVVPQGYDFELWTKEQNDAYNLRWPSKAEAFEDVVKRTVAGML